MRRAFDIALDVAIMTIIVTSFLWGGYVSRTEPVAGKPAQITHRD